MSTLTGLKPQDVVVSLKLVVREGKRWSYPTLAPELGLSVSAVHQAVERCRRAGLLVGGNGEEPPQPQRSKLYEFVVAAVPTLYFPVKGEITKGVATAFHSKPVAALSSVFQGPNGGIPLVWPWAEGDTKGETLRPLYKSAPAAALLDDRLYEMLALIDVMRVGGTRDRKAAADVLKVRITHGGNR